MKKVGTLTWVAPEQVVAVDWDPVTKAMPRLWLTGGGLVLADDYAAPRGSSTEKRETEMMRMLVDLGLDDRRRGASRYFDFPG